MHSVARSAESTHVTKPLTQATVPSYQHCAVRPASPTSSRHDDIISLSYNGRLTDIHTLYGRGRLNARYKTLGPIVEGFHNEAHTDSVSMCRIESKSSMVTFLCRQTIFTSIITSMARNSLLCADVP